MAVAIDAVDESRLPAVAAISCLSLAELRAGPNSATDLTERIRRLRHVKRLQAQVTMLPFDLVCAGAYGRVHAAVSAVGRKPRGRRAVDLMIAATAGAYDLPLYTFNAADLRGLDGLIEIVDLA